MDNKAFYVSTGGRQCMFNGVLYAVDDNVVVTVDNA
jgi:hypothetical protein